MARWNGLEQPQRDRGGAGAARGAAPARAGCGDGACGAEHRPRRNTPTGQPACGLGRRRRLQCGGGSVGGRGRVHAARSARAPVAAPPPPADSAAPARDTGTRCSWTWPAAGAVVAGFDDGTQQGPGHRRQGRRPGPRRRRRAAWSMPGSVAARLRQPGHRQAQRHLPDGLRPQPGAAGQGRPGRAPRAEDRRDGFDATPSGCSCTSRSADRASRSIRHKLLPPR